MKLTNVLMVVLILSSCGFAQSISSHCTDAGCTTIGVIDEHHVVVATEGEAHVIDPTQNYTQTICLSCTEEGDTIRSRQLLRLAYYQTDDGLQVSFEELKTFLNELPHTRRKF
jgi:hypothetical protein